MIVKDHKLVIDGCRTRNCYPYLIKFECVFPCRKAFFLQFGVCFTLGDNFVYPFNISVFLGFTTFIDICNCSLLMVTGPLCVIPCIFILSLPAIITGGTTKDVGGFCMNYCGLHAILSGRCNKCVFDLIFIHYIRHIKHTLYT